MNEFSHFKTEEYDDVTVVTFSDNKIIDDLVVDSIGQGLSQLMNDGTRRKIVLDFTNVQWISSSLLGKFIRLQKILKATQGYRIRMIGMTPQIKELFSLTGLNKLFDLGVDTLTKAIATDFKEIPSTKQ